MDPKNVAKTQEKMHEKAENHNTTRQNHRGSLVNLKIGRRWKRGE